MEASAKLNLEQFLRKNRVLTKFKNNYRKLNLSNHSRRFDEFLDEYSNTPHVAILCAFCWADSPEEHDFWSELTREAREHANEN